MSNGEMFNRAAESFVLAGVMRNSDAWHTVRDLGLTKADFGAPENKTVMGAFEAVAEQRGEPELTLVIEVLRGQGNSDHEEYLEKLLTLPSTGSHAIENARLVKGLTVARDLCAAGVKLIEIGQERRGDYDSALSDAETVMRRVKLHVPQMEFATDPGGILKELRARGPDVGVPVRSMPSLQNFTGGMIPGHTWVVGGFSSTGKSAFGVNLAYDALLAGKWVGVVSTEMTSAQYAIRFLSLMSGVPQLTVRNRIVLHPEQQIALENAETWLTGAPLRIYDSISKLEAITAVAIRQKQTVGLDVLLVDFLQNVRGSTGDFSYGDLTEAVVELQDLAKQLHCTVIAFSQVSNDQAYRDKEGEREVYAFKGSGALKDAADVAIMLRRDRINRSPTLEVDVVKHRHGEMGKFAAMLHLETGRIEELA